jgi:hypothetical protein
LIGDRQEPVHPWGKSAHIVHENVDAITGHRHKPVRPRRVGQVNLNHGRGTGIHEFLQLGRFRSRADDDVSALGRETLCDRQPDTAARAGHHHDQTFQTELHVRLLDRLAARESSAPVAFPGPDPAVCMADPTSSQACCRPCDRPHCDCRGLTTARGRV